MPNIIEQQDLLKGLPDNRLALLLQQPTGDIPPFLVAAEAQRRQSIRAQFSGNANNESVVDSLTKQLVPQNIQAPVNAPPQIPPTPPMAGVAALQQQQAMQQAAMNAQQMPPQQMRAGGEVKRFNNGGLSITDMYPQLRPRVPQRVPPVVNNETVFAPSVSDFSEFGPLPAPPTIEEIIRMEDDATKRRREEYADRKEREETNEGFLEDVALPDTPIPKLKGLSQEEIDRENQRLRQTLEMQRMQNQEKAPGETEDDFRARIEALYSGAEPSDWEKAQRWFAMSEQFLDPSKTTMQSVAGAGRAFSEQSAAMSAAQREAEVAKQKALLEWDINERNRTLDAESRRAQREYESQLKIDERRTVTADATMRAMETRASALVKQLYDVDEKMMGATEEEKTAVKSQIQDQIDALNMKIAQLAKQSGYDFGPVVTVDDLRRAVQQQAAAGN
jgi:hypothetical protein